jgi:hypothetical protein
MPNMNDQHIARLEAQLERLVEGAFAHLFGKKIRAQDIALQLARAMEDGAESSTSDARPVAPDAYIIYVHPDVRAGLLQRQPALETILGQHMVELATNAGYRLNRNPVIELQADYNLGPAQLLVIASHTIRKTGTTAVLKRVEMPPPQPAPLNPQLLVDGYTAVPLTQEVINVGRSRDNHLVIDDPTVSRHHLQLRLRFGHYELFDTQSNAGTFVNDMRVKEHILQSGDVIRIGNTQIVYMEDHPMSDSQTSTSPTVDIDPA